MSAGNVPSGHHFSSLMSLGSPYNSATAGNGCTGLLERVLLTLTSISACRLVVAVSWFVVCFHSMIGLLFMSSMVDGNLNGNRYLQEVFKPFVIPAPRRIGTAAMFPDDNARPHHARIVTHFLRQHNVNRMDWPQYSPDLNSIEHAWDELGRRLRRNHVPPTNHAHLARMLVAEWQAIPQAFFQRLVNSMRLRCTECINARGGYTHY